MLNIILLCSYYESFSIPLSGMCSVPITMHRRMHKLKSQWLVILPAFDLACVTGSTMVSLHPYLTHVHFYYMYMAFCLVKGTL